jgi:predicted dehydrogenase
MCTTRAYIRAVHVEYAVSKGINVFMEKPFASDPAGVKTILRAAELADQNGAKIAAGLQCRHSPARQALIRKIRDGELGEIPLVRANRLTGRRWMSPQKDALDFQAQLGFGRVNLLWVGSGHMIDNLIHQIDECCWIKDSWPVSCVGMGGREPYSTDCGQNHDTYAMEYTFADGTKAMCGFRRANRGRGEFATWIHGAKCGAQFSGQTHAATVHIFKDQRMTNDNILWTPEKDADSPWQYEWNDFIDSIRNDKPHNEARRAAYADIASLMGRVACHTAQEVKWDDIKDSKFAFIDDLEGLDYDSPVPVKPDASGQFPIPGGTGWKEV